MLRVVQGAGGRRGNMAPEQPAEGIIPRLDGSARYSRQALTDAVEAGFIRQRKVVPRADTLVFRDGKTGVFFRAE